MRVQLTHAGAHVDVSASELAAVKEEFNRRHCFLLRQLIEPGLLARLHEKLASASFFNKTNADVGDESRMTSDPVGAALEFLTNDPKLFAFVRAVTGIGEIGCFRGRVYRLLPNTGQMSDWHDDFMYGRMATISINLSAGIYEGGLLQFRKAAEPDTIISEIHNTGFGDASLFKIDQSIQHRVTPATGTVPRTAYAGWFVQRPQFADLLKERLNTSGVRA
ncbi:MAG: 2OG-Fe(II) oxygenase [Acidobacteriaceae bacterium]|jgi:hypothetical protein|nr:2OG-Fe(II) oxygenase [Acidobacteriaceae bacterium]